MTSTFVVHAAAAISAHDFESGRVPGQAVIDLPNVVDCVSCGIGRRTDDANDYVLRKHRGRVEAFLRRDKASRCGSVRIVVYTREAYLADPDIREDEDEMQRVKEIDPTHVLVAVLAESDEAANSPVGLTRFVANLAGGNNEAATWSADEIRDLAKRVMAYDTEWCVVSD